MHEVGLLFLPAIGEELPPSFLRFTAIQSVERKEDLADLAPKRRFIAAEAVERVVGQIGETQKAMRERSGGHAGNLG